MGRGREDQFGVREDGMTLRRHEAALQFESEVAHVGRA
jgi:hypothetical protein